MPGVAYAAYSTVPEFDFSITYYISYDVHYRTFGSRSLNWKVILILDRERGRVEGLKRGPF